MELTQVIPSFGPVLSRNVIYLISNIDSFDKECVDWFAEFFSMMLSQTQYDYEWKAVQQIEKNPGV